MSGITSIQNNQMFSEKSNHTFNVSTKSVITSTNQTGSQTNEEDVTTSKDGDTLEISATATALARNTFSATSASSGTVSTDEGYTSKMSETISNAAASVGITQESAAKSEMSTQSAAVSGSSSGSSSSSTSDLSSYTATELKEMLQNGEITQAEYNAEMESRSSSVSSSEESNSTEGNANTAQETEA